MTIWAILDTTNTIINVVDDIGGTVPVMQYTVGQRQLDLKTLPPSATTGAQLQPDGSWSALGQYATQNIIDQLTALSTLQLVSVLNAVSVSAPMIAAKLTMTVTATSASSAVVVVP